MLIGPDRLGFTALYQPLKKRSFQLIKWTVPDWPAPMLMTPDVEPMHGIAQPAHLIRRVRSNVMFRKFRHRYDKPNRNTAF